MSNQTGGLILLFASAILILAFWPEITDGLRRYQLMRRTIKPATNSKPGPLSRLFHRKRKLKVTLVEIRDFVVNLQLAVSLEETLSGALAETASVFDGRGDFGERLNRHVQSRLALSPNDVIQGMADDFDSDDLRDLIRRLEIARDGGMTHVQALAVSVEELEDEIKSTIEKEIQRAPVVLTIPMVVGVFFTALIIGMYPLMVILIRVIANPFQ
ncbi:MAG: hypothetical protein EXR62_13365 [Chloroflexi bacterium]|nr:hypothetical protein [Chloroflexota bacterium]